MRSGHAVWALISDKEHQTADLHCQDLPVTGIAAGAAAGVAAEINPPPFCCSTGVETLISREETVGMPLAPLVACALTATAAINTSMHAAKPLKADLGCMKWPAEGRERADMDAAEHSVTVRYWS